MKIIEERQFNIIPDKLYKKLSKRDRDSIHSYNLAYRWYKYNVDKLKLLEKEVIRMIKMYDFKNQYLNIKNEIDTAVQNVLNDSAFSNGKYVQEFENKFCHQEI